MSYKTRTVREVVAYLSKLDQEQVIAINQMWLKEDAEEFTSEVLTDQQWDNIAFYYENNERLSDDGIETLCDAVREETN